MMGCVDGRRPADFTLGSLPLAPVGRGRRDARQGLVGQRPQATVGPVPGALPLGRQDGAGSHHVPDQA